MSLGRVLVEEFQPDVLKWLRERVEVAKSRCKGSGLAILQLRLYTYAVARPLRPEFPGAVYHLTSRGNARQRIFLADADREHFLSTLSGVIVRYGWICHAYCLMENDYHLLVETPCVHGVGPA